MSAVEPATGPTGVARHVLRGSFTLLERVAPALGAALGARISSRLPEPRRDRPVLPEGGRDIDVVVDGTRLTGRRWGSAGRHVYLTHGWAGFGAQLAPLIAPLSAAGLTVVVYDQPGHGESWRAGARSSVGQFTAALEAVTAVYGPAHAVVTHSMGALGLGWALRRGLPVNRVVLLAPTARIVDAVDVFVTMSGSGPRIRSRMIARMPGRTGLPAEALELPNLVADVDVPSTLVVHDSGDSWTPVAGGRAIAACWPRARLLETSGLGHYGILSDPAVGRAVLEHVLAGGDEPARASLGAAKR